MEILERCRYTVTLSLSYCLPSGNGFAMDPDITVRAYLDGQQAEILAIGKLGEHPRHAAFSKLLRAHRAELNRRWQRNIILNKWLDYLVEQGHLVLDR